MLKKFFSLSCKKSIFQTFAFTRNAEHLMRKIHRKQLLNLNVFKTSQEIALKASEQKIYVAILPFY